MSINQISNARKMDGPSIKIKLEQSLSLSLRKDSSQYVTSITKTDNSFEVSDEFEESDSSAKNHITQINLKEFVPKTNDLNKVQRVRDTKGSPNLTEHLKPPIRSRAEYQLIPQSKVTQRRNNGSLQHFLNSKNKMSAHESLNHPQQLPSKMIQRQKNHQPNADDTIEYNSLNAFENHQQSQRNQCLLKDNSLIRLVMRDNTAHLTINKHVNDTAGLQGLLNSIDSSSDIDSIEFEDCSNKEIDQILENGKSPSRNTVIRNTDESVEGDFRYRKTYDSIIRDNSFFKNQLKMHNLFPCEIEEEKNEYIKHNPALSKKEGAASKVGSGQVKIKNVLTYQIQATSNSIILSYQLKPQSRLSEAHVITNHLPQMHQIQLTQSARRKQNNAQSGDKENQTFCQVDDWTVLDYDLKDIFSKVNEPSHINVNQGKKQGFFTKYNSTAENIDTVQEFPVVQGWLLKYSNRSVFPHWKQKYVILKNKQVKYYKNEKCEQLLGCIDFDLLNCLIRVNGNLNTKSFGIEVIGKNKEKAKVFNFEASSNKEMHKWVEALYLHQSKSLGSKENLKSNLVMQKQFWKENRINLTAFKGVVDTGDILLFQSKAVGSKVQRVFTGSKVDHIALILRYSNGKIVLFESLRETGVNVCDWDRFLTMKWNDLYHKVIYRRLQYPKTQSFVGSLEDFVRQTIGKPFKINVTKLMRKKNQCDNADQIKESKSFFCSELVATAYKRLGLLDQRVAASQYWPGDFSTEDLNKTVKLLDNATLGEEQLIDFTAS